MYLYINCLVYSLQIITIDAISKSRYARIMTMDINNEENLNTPSPLIASTFPSNPSPNITIQRFPTSDTNFQIYSTNPPLPHSNGFSSTDPTVGISAFALANEKCEEYHDWLIRRSTFQFFIINGTPAIGKEFPHMAALGFGPENMTQWLCGGSLISKQYVLTAAHCLKSMELGPVRWAKLGEVNLKSDTSTTSQLFSVVERIAHPDYSTATKYNDIALLKLDRPVEFSEYVLPICLSTSEGDIQEKLTATGWGKTQLTGPPSSELMKVDLEYFPHDACQKAYDDVSGRDLPAGILPDKQICAGSKNDQRDTCQGDSGGPLQINTDKLYLIGIISIGKKCGIPNIPAIYTRVIYYISWIADIVWKYE